MPPAGLLSHPFSVCLQKKSNENLFINKPWLTISMALGKRVYLLMKHEEHNHSWDLIAVFEKLLIELKN